MEHKRLCYYCGESASTDEHLPPDSFFPVGKNFQLITVPSCEEHNNKKSKDDEYVRMMLLRSHKVDGKSHLQGLRDKVARSLGRAANRVANQPVSAEKAGKIDELLATLPHEENPPLRAAQIIDQLENEGLLKTGLLGLAHKSPREELTQENIPTFSTEIDLPRFEKFFEYLSKGILFHETNNRCIGKVRIGLHFLLKADAPEEDKNKSKFYLSNFNRELAKGSQKEIFCYEFFRNVSSSSGKVEIVLNMCLYDSFHITAIFNPDELA